MSISHISQKISTRKEEHLACKAHKVRKVITEHLLLSITSVNNTENKPKDYVPCIGLKPMNVIVEQKKPNL